MIKQIPKYRSYTSQLQTIIYAFRLLFRHVDKLDNQ